MTHNSKVENNVSITRLHPLMHTLVWSRASQRLVHTHTLNVVLALLYLVEEEKAITSIPAI